MSAYVTAILNCDRCGEVYEGRRRATSTTVERRNARRDGWVRKHYRGFLSDLCPRCQVDAKQPIDGLR